eukprot:scaffold1700_cov286-Chaetoceros_neogracile.AAC.3
MKLSWSWCKKLCPGKLLLSDGLRRSQADVGQNVRGGSGKGLCYGYKNDEQSCTAIISSRADVRYEMEKDIATLDIHLNIAPKVMALEWVRLVVQYTMIRPHSDGEDMRWDITHSSAGGA